MGPELIAAVFGPLLAGALTLAIWQSKNNSDNITRSLDEMHSCVHKVDQKVDEFCIKAAETYVTREELRGHVEAESDWHDQHHTEVKELRAEMNEKTEKLAHDVAEMKDMQWQIRLDQLEIKSRIENDE